MQNRNDYERIKRDVDGSYFWSMNKDVNYWVNEDIMDIKEFDELARWDRKQQEKLSKHSLYYKGTALYFTYKNKKYYISWTFYSDSYIEELIKRLKAIDGVTNLQLNWGELD